MLIKNNTGRNIYLTCAESCVQIAAVLKIPNLVLAKQQPIKKIIRTGILHRKSINVVVYT